MHFMKGIAMSSPSLTSYQGREQSISPSTYETENAMKPVTDVLDYLKQYAREKPEIAALTCFAVGFFLGWKLKPW
jgi:hypothetical protein